ncbi:MAG: amidohydrolase family protein [Planctomycetota bacterium]|jgi:imidazolonepropionase-like amidohydrolase
MLILSNVGKLYDGTSADESAVHTGVDLHIDGDRIAELRPHDPRLAVGDAHTLIDASAWTVTPGMIDCHGHITVLGLAGDDMDTMLGSDALLYVEKILYTTLVDGGCTTMRDIGGATHRIKQLVNDGILIGPRLKIAICMLSTTGGHADFRGPDRCHAELSRLWPEAPGRPSSIVDGPWEARKRVREIAACGADLIKLCTSPGVASPSDALEHRDFTAEEIEAICEEAGARGLSVAAHAHSVTGIEMAIDHGVHDIQHISFMDERLVERAHAKGCTVTPTSWVMHELPDAGGLSPFVMEKVKRVADVHHLAVQHAAAGGLKILAGTDAVLPGMHGRNWMEIVALVKDGLSPLAAWHAATGLAADEIGQDDTGTLRAGQRADLLVCTEDVIDDPNLFDEGALLEVIQDGRGHRGGIEGVPQRAFRSTVDAALKRED